MIMKNIKHIALIAFLMVFGGDAYAQRVTAFLELGGYGMTQNYLGDVNGGSLGALTQEARFGLGTQLKYNFSSLLSVGADVNYGSLYSHDNLHGNADRDYQVDTDLLNISLFTNVHFIPFGKYNQRNHHTPFIHAGIGALTYQPHLNTNAQYPDGIALYPGTGHTYAYSVGFGWRIRKKLKSFYNIGVYYNGFGASNIEGFNYDADYLDANPALSNFNDGSLVVKFGMSFGFFEQ
ncbi:MAG: hypothetical protein RLZZ599_1268 [Bacteroidota bacterium]|jgi:hypothetical protein